MEKDIRSYILNRVKSPLMTVEQFNWDNLKGPRVSDLFSPYDLSELHNLATSLKLSAKTKEKINRIDQIMYSRGFKRFITGTNRLTYRFIEDTSFIAKVAYNNVGTTDAPREFRNQMVLKPFVPKIFDYTPDGVISIEERVEPITNREEFMSIAEDVYTLITEWLVGEYVFDDIGTDYFMNYGIRKGFGVVILDFPYMFKVDYGKLICAAKDKTGTTISGTCEGEIDYDDGFNKLYCTKCGAIYTARDLSKKVEEDKVLIKPNLGGLGKMFLNINISGGSKKVNNNEVVGNEFNTKIPNKPITPANDTAANFCVNGVNTNEKKEKPVVEEKKDEVEETDLGTPDSTEDFELNNDDEQEATYKKKDLESPFVVHDEDDKEFAEKGKNIKELTDEDINKIFSDSESAVNNIKAAIDKLPEEDLVEVVKHILKMITIETSDHNNIKIDHIKDDNSGVELKALMIDIYPEVQVGEQVIKLDEDSTLTVALSVPYIVDLINNSEGFIASNDKNAKYTGFVDYAGTILNKKDIDQNINNENAFVLIGENGNYLTDAFGNILCITKIDNKPVSNVSLISNSRMAMLNSSNQNNDQHTGYKKETKNLKPGAVASNAVTEEE